MNLPKAGAEVEVLRSHGKIVFKQDFEYPDGKIHQFLLFKAGSPVTIFPLTKNREVIAINQFRHAVNQCLIELPGGNSRDSRETPEEIAHNELLEETGFKSEKIGRLGWGDIWFEPFSLRVSYIPILALDCTHVKPPQLDETEVIETRLFPLAEWIRMIFSGEITDSKSIAVTFRALPYLGVTMNLPKV
jgi:ADP-ribose pyrophosphatase